MVRALVFTLSVMAFAVPEPVGYRPPVTAPVADPFRPPATPYGSGNRGLEYDTARGAPVRSAAAGTVTFAGQVGGRLHVTVLHADGLRTTYGPLARIGVRRGRRLAAGDVLGAAGEHLLWTARLGGVYVDPAALLAATGELRVRLVPDRPVGARSGTAATLVRWSEPLATHTDISDPGHPTVARQRARPVSRPTDGKEGRWPPSSR